VTEPRHRLSNLSKAPSSAAAPSASGSADELTVLYVDGGIGFGGSSKSLALALNGLTNVRKLMISAQQPNLIRELFPSIRTWTFKGWINYRTRDRFSEFVEALPCPARLRAWAMKAYAALDLMAGHMNAYRVARLVRRHKVDLIHMNNGFSPPEVVLAARMTGVPLIGHLRGIAVPPFSPGFRDLIAQAECTIAVSDAAGAALKIAVPGARIETIHNPVDFSRMTDALPARAAIRTELGATDDDFVVGIFGRIVQWKGQLEFVEACIGAMEQNPKVLAVIVGSISDGSAKYLEAVEQAIGASPFPHRFVLTGYRSDVEALYAAMDTVVHASTSPEPFGRVIAEAMAAGKPVIAMDAGGPREIITPEVDGLLVPPGDSESMRRAILELAGDANRCATMGARAKETATSRFTIARHAEEILKVYRRVLAARGGAS
jgi:glycosyltransferase involved in cell wall biosynthesis